MSTNQDTFDVPPVLSQPETEAIKYRDCSEEQLRTEISDYMVTEEIEASLRRVLEGIESLQSAGHRPYTGVLVTGDLGAGKSSFTKYLGLALDQNMEVDGRTFHDLLRSKFRNDDTKDLLEQVASSFNPTVFFLDLNEEMMTSALKEDISTVLYRKVLQWSGYSNDLTVARFERILDSDGKLDAFKALAKEEMDGVDWNMVQNQPLVAMRIVSQLAVEFYPGLFQSESDLSRLMAENSMGINRRAEEMIELIRKKSGKANIVFIFDDVDSYIFANPSRALDFHSMNQYLASIGQGSICVMATSEPYHNSWDASPSTGIILEKFMIRIHLESRNAKLSYPH